MRTSSFSWSTHFRLLAVSISARNTKLPRFAHFVGAGDDHICEHVARLAAWRAIFKHIRRFKYVGVQCVHHHPKRNDSIQSGPARLRFWNLKRDPALFRRLAGDRGYEQDMSALGIGDNNRHARRAFLAAFGSAKQFFPISEKMILKNLSRRGELACHGNVPLHPCRTVPPVRQACLQRPLQPASSCHP